MSYDYDPPKTVKLEKDEYSFNGAGLEFSIKYNGGSKISDVKGLSFMGQPIKRFSEIAVLHSHIISLLRDRSTEGDLIISGTTFNLRTIEKTMGKTKGHDRKEKALSITTPGATGRIISYQEAVLLDIGLHTLRQLFKV